MAEATSQQDAAQKERNAVEQVVATKAYVDNPGLLPWYTAELEEPTAETKALFQQYCNLSGDDVVPHIKKVRDEAFKIVRILLKAIKVVIGLKRILVSVSLPR